MATARRGEASCKLVTGSLKLELQQAAGEEEERAGGGRRGGGGTDEGRPGELLVGGDLPPSRHQGGAAEESLTVSSQEKQADQIKNRVVTSHPPAQLWILCYSIQ